MNHASNRRTLQNDSELSTTEHGENGTPAKRPNTRYDIGSERHKTQPIRRLQMRRQKLLKAATDTYLKFFYWG